MRKNVNKVKSKQQKKYEAFIAQCVKNAKSKEFKERRRQEFIKSYSKQLKVGEAIEPKENWAEGNISKKDLFKPATFKNRDLDEINKKRKALGLPDIETGDAQALEEIKNKSKRVAPLYNKGGYQYLGNGQDIKDAGKKTSQL